MELPFTYTQAGGFLTGIAVINRDISQPPMKRGNTEKPRRPGKVSSQIVTMSLDISLCVGLENSSKGGV